MATAAPSVPGPAASAEGSPAPSADPQSTPQAQPDVQHAAEPQPDGDPGAQPEPSKPVRPIPPKKPARPPLPGVDDGGDFPLALPPPPPTRGADGKFQPKPGEPAPDGEPQPDAEPEQKPAKFKFAGEEWESEEKAAQNFKTLRGMHKAQQEQITLSNQRGHEWKRAYERDTAALRAEIAELRRGSPATPHQPQPAAASASQPADPNAAGDGIDWEYYRELSAEAAKVGRPELAQKWLNEQMAAKIQAGVQKALDEALAPERASRQWNEAASAAQALVESVANLSYSDGSPAYPELKTPEGVQAVGRFYIEQGGDGRALLTAAGLRSAVDFYRTNHPGKSGGAPAPAASAPSPAANPQPAAAPEPEPGLSPSDLADTSLDGGGLPPRPELLENVSPQVKALVTSLTKESRRVATLGFDR